MFKFESDKWSGVITHDLPPQFPEHVKVVANLRLRKEVGTDPKKARDFSRSTGRIVPKKSSSLAPPRGTHKRKSMDNWLISDSTCQDGSTWETLNRFDRVKVFFGFVRHSLVSRRLRTPGKTTEPTKNFSKFQQNQKSKLNEYLGHQNSYKYSL